ncbi:MAG: hypothetical protein KGJ13_07985 [Patescibacteria group bacterium]|nr:hypothetical protein [Patescibacteria group bacterium]
MHLLALEIIEHAKVHVAKIYLLSPKSPHDSREFAQTMGILDRAGNELESDLISMHMPVGYRPFASRQRTEVN